MSQLTRVVASFLSQGRPLIKSDLAELRELMTRLSKPQNEAIIKTLLDQLPEALTDQTRTGTYGSWYNYYLCGFRGRHHAAEVHRHHTRRDQPAQRPAEAAQQHRVPQRCEEVLDVKRYSDGAILRLGAYTLVIMLIVMAAAFNLSKFPGFGGKVYHAEFTDASGLHPGNMVQIAGIRAGRVESISLEKNKVLVDFRVKNGYHFGNQSKASVEVLNLLGEKYLDLNPPAAGS